MAVSDHAVSPGPLRVADDADVSNWLEALSAGECTLDEFVAEILRREPQAPDVGWEALALLDQEFRRQKITGDDYTNLKSRLHQHFVEGHGARHARQRAPDPMVASRDAPVGEIPVVTTAFDSAERPAVRVDVPLHGELRVGDRLRDRYRVVEILRRNAAGTLVEAIDEQKIDLPGVRKRVAIQVVNETLSGDREYLRRVGALQSLAHPSISRVFDVEEEGDALLVVMELLNGPSLHDLQVRAADGETHAGLAQSALRATARALIYSHSQNVAHGSVAARNILLTQTGDFRLQGFELQGTYPADPAADRRDFARLAYQVLGGAETVDPEMEKLPRRTPQGITRPQWRAMRRALKGKEGDPEVFATFANDAPAGSSGGWRAASIVLVILGLGAGGYLYANATWTNSTEPPPSTAAVDAVSDATPPPPPVAPPDVSDAPTADTAPVVASLPPARARIDLPVRLASVESSAPVARIWVRRRDNLSGPVSFKWWTESGTAEVDRDFRRILPRIETIPSGANGVELLVPLVPEAARLEPRTFWVKIDEPSRGTRLGESTLMQVTIVPVGT
jgi:hypothetical protein